MRVLQLCHKNPFPAKDGGCLAISAITKGFIENGIELHVLVMRTEKHNSDASAWPEEYRSKSKITIVDVDTSVNIIAALKSLLNRTSYNLSRFYSEDYRKQLKTILMQQTFDVIHIESLFACLYTRTIRKYSKAKVVYRSHNVESQIWERLSKGTKSFFKRWYLNILAERLKRFERQDMTNYDLILSITEADRQWYIDKGVRPENVITIPFGVDLSNYKKANTVDEKSVCFIGSLDWMPNVQGIDWFLKDVWPLVVQEVPAAKFYLAGRSMPDRFKQHKDRGYIPVGEVEDAVQFFAPKSIMAIPLLTGGGMRVKVIEAMAVGKAIVSTSIGAENIEITNGENMIIADDAISFAKSLIVLLNDNNRIAHIGNAARAVIERKYDNKLLVRSILSHYNNYKYT